LVVKVLEHRPVLLAGVDLEKGSCRRTVVDEAEEVAEGDVRLEVKEDVVDWKSERYVERDRDVRR
jgi:hypothetical protein